MNIFLRFANIIIVLAIIVIIYSLLIFPIFLSGNLFVNFNKKEVFYTIKLFGIIKFLYGYFELDDEGIIVHLNKSKAILIRFNEILSIKKKFKPLRDYHLLKFNSKLEIGAYENNLRIELTSIYGFIMMLLKNIFYNIKPYFELKNTINIYEDSDILHFYCNANLVLNLLMIIISGIKIIVEKIIYAIKNRTQQNKQCN